MKKLLMAALFMFMATGCETMQAVKEQVKPQTAREGVLYAYGQLYIAKEVVAYNYSNPVSDDVDKGLNLLISDKIAAMYQTALSNDIQSYRNGVTTYEQALNAVRKTSEAYNKIDATEEPYKTIKDSLTKLEGSIDTSSIALDASAAISACKIQVNEIELPCTSKSDYLLAVLIKIKQNQR